MSDIHGTREELVAMIVSLRAALRTLIESAKLCPSCHEENECYVFSMTALADAGAALGQGGDK